MIMTRYIFLRLALVSLFAFSASRGFSAELTTEEIVQAAIPAIVSIRTQYSDGRGLGTGFLVKPDGVIVTNLHVVEGAIRVEIKLHSGEVHDQVRIASFDQARDLAVLRIPGFDLPIIPVGNSESVTTGEAVVAIGNPGGLEETVTSGIVSSIRVQKDGTKVIQTDSAVSPGSSGGPLINKDGEVIGIVTFKVLGGESLNFAIPVNYARGLLGIEDLMTLAQFNQRIGDAKVSLFAKEGADSTGSLTGSWLSLTSNTQRELTFSGEYIYGSFNFDDKSEGTISNGTYDLKRTDEKMYEGETTAHWNCWYYRFGKKVENFCTDKIKTELTLVAPDRIEGRMYGEQSVGPSDRGFKKACDSCNDNQPSKWEDFVWVRRD